MSAETSTFTKSTLDSYVNLLRAGNEAFTAVLGGIDYLHVSPFDEVTADSNDFSARIARNTQLLFREESHVNKVIDPAGGSYYLESLTADLVESGWRFFQDLDRRGGIFQALESGSLQLEINKTLEKRMEDVKTRAKSMIGVNVFAQLNEKPTFPQSKIAKPNAKAGEMKIQPIPETRLAEPFEHLRERAIALVNRGVEPTVRLICLGSMRDYKPRMDFITGMMAAGGIQTISSADCLTLDDVKAFVNESEGTYFCLCGSEEMYAKLAQEIGHWLHEAYPHRIVDIAGHFDREQLSVFKINDAISLVQNMYEKLDSLLSSWEVTADEQQT